MLGRIIALFAVVAAAVILLERAQNDADSTMSDKPVDGDVEPCSASDTCPGHSIRIEGTPEEQARIQAMLDKVRTTESGRKQLESIDNAKHQVTIKYADIKKHGPGFTYAAYPGTEKPLEPGPDRKKQRDGVGTDAVLELDRDIHERPMVHVTKDGKTFEAPPDSTLMHELTHADDIVHGEVPDANKGQNVEARAVKQENTYGSQRQPPVPARDDDYFGVVGDKYAP